MDRKEKLYNDFHGKQAKEEYSLDIEDFEILVELGEAVAIEYKVKKRADKKEHIYRHEFKKGAKVLTNGKQLLVYGSKIKVTERGIIN